MKICAIKDCSGNAVRNGMCSTHRKRWAKGDYTIKIDKLYTCKGDFDNKMKEFTERKENGCLEWTGPISNTGYGRMFYDGNRTRAHRAVFIHNKGPLQKGYDVHHICENRICVEITHLQCLSKSDHSKTHPKKRDRYGRIVSHDNS